MVSLISGVLRQELPCNVFDQSVTVIEGDLDHLHAWVAADDCQVRVACQGDGAQDVESRHGKCLFYDRQEFFALQLDGADLIDHQQVGNAHTLLDGVQDERLHGGVVQ